MDDDGPKCMTERQIRDYLRSQGLPPTFVEQVARAWIDDRIQAVEDVLGGYAIIE
jgi:hypothetical protein